MPNLPNIWETPLPNFNFSALYWINSERNQHRFYQVRWEPTLLDDAAIGFGFFNHGNKMEVSILNLFPAQYRPRVGKGC